MKKTFLLLFALVIFMSCQQQDHKFGLASEFYPTPQLLKEGVANKYFEHFSAPNTQTSTNIQFVTYQAQAGNRLAVTYYDAGYQPTLKRILKYKADQFIVESETSLRTGEFEANLISATFQNWNLDSVTSSYQRAYQYSDVSGSTSTSHRSLPGDTMVDARAARKFALSYKGYEYHKTDTFHFEGKGYNLYVKGHSTRIKISWI